MRVFLDRSARKLIRNLYFIKLILLLVLIFGKNTSYIVFIYFILWIVSDFTLYKYLKNENKIISQAIIDIQSYINSSSKGVIDCYKEGQLSRLFHEINSLIAILNAHRYKEEKNKDFLKNIILDISHQIKTPITALNIYNDIIQAEVEEDSTSQEFAKLSEEELDRINILLKNLLTMSKFDTNTIEMNKKYEDIFEIFMDIKGKFRYRERREGKRIIISGSRDIKLFCDKMWLSEALGNIVKNALDHTVKGDIIEIEFKYIGSFLQIKINDNGSGIPSEDINHIFKRFYRSKFSKENQGIGLGLPLAKQVIDAHGGIIEVESEVKEGTCFIINFCIPTKL